MEKGSHEFFANYFQEINELVASISLQSVDDIVQVVKKSRSEHGKAILVGNGAANSIASHFALDFGKQACWDAISFTDPALITAYTNDFGAEKAMANFVSRYGVSGDVLFVISASGASPNILAAAKAAKDAGICVVGLTGFGDCTPLCGLSQYVIGVDSKAYNIIEGVHALVMGAICDGIIGKSVYSV